MTRKIQTGKPFRLFVLLLLLTLIISKAAMAQTTAFTYQGKLTDAGNPANGNYDLQFKLFDALAAGAQQGATLVRTPVLASAGIFTVTLDFGATVFGGADRYLEIGVRPAGSANAYTVLAPRQTLTAAPYAIRTLAATAADSLSAACVNCVTSGQIQNVQGAQVTGEIPVAGVPAGSANYIQNTASLQAGSNFNLSGNGTAGSFNAVTQYNLGGTRILGAAGTLNFFAGVSAGQANTSGNRNTFVGSGAGQNNTTGASNSFFGRAAGSNNTGSANSFFGESAGSSFTGFPSGAGNTFLGYSAGALVAGGDDLTLVGQNANVGANNLSNATAIGARALVTQSNTLILGSINGVNGATASTNVGIGTATPQYRLHVKDDNAPAIAGESTGNTGVGVFGSSTIYIGVVGTSTSHLGVFGSSNSSSGVHGQSIVASLGAAGVYGINNASGGIGVIGEANIGNGTGVYGVSTSASGFGMYGRNTLGGYAGYFDGKVRVIGVIEKPGGGFKIDHPLDPENKYLVHSFVESPDMKNLYDGTVTTDAQGEAEITLPDWFAALNRDFRYQLTCIGVFAQAIIAEEIKDNRFKIRTSLPQVKVSWQVTGTRQDAWAKQNRLPVEELKPAVERGFYQNPSAFGQPEEKSLEWARHPEMMKQQKEAREKAARAQNDKTAAPAARPNH